MDETPKPAILQCLACDYDLAGIEADACPECGTTMQDQVAWAERREELEASSSDYASRQVLMILLLPLAYGVMAGSLLGSVQSVVAVTIWVWLVVVLSSVGVMTLEAVSRLAYERRHRKLIGFAWDRQFLLVHSPWLLSPVFGAMIAVSLPAWRVDPSFKSGLGAMLCLGVVVLLCTKASQRFDAETKAMGINANETQRIGTSVALLGGMAVACVPGLVVSMVFAGAYGEVVR